MKKKAKINSIKHTEEFINRKIRAYDRYYSQNRVSKEELGSNYHSYYKQKKTVRPNNDIDENDFSESKISG